MSFFRQMKRKLQWLLAFCLLISLIFFSSSLLPWRSEPSLLAPLSYPVALLERFWHSGSHSALGLWQRYVSLVGAERENQQLREEIILLRGRLVNHEALAHEVLQLKDLLGFVRTQKNDLLAAEVISRGAGGGFESLRIDKGTSDGVDVGMVVLSVLGVVGRVMRVRSFYADVQPLTSPEASVDILLQRTRLRGVLKGTGAGYLEWHPTERGDIKIGDVALTSGMIPSSPKGFPVAEVVKIAYGLDEASQKVLLRPWQDIRKLEYLFVVKIQDAVAQQLRDGR